MHTMRIVAGRGVAQTTAMGEVFMSGRMNGRKMEGREIWTERRTVGAMHATTTNRQCRFRVRVLELIAVELKDEILVVISPATAVPLWVVVLADGLGSCFAFFPIVHGSTVALNFYIAIAGPGSDWVNLSIYTVHVGSLYHCQEEHYREIGEA